MNEPDELRERRLRRLSDTLGLPVAGVRQRHTARGDVWLVELTDGRPVTLGSSRRVTKPARLTEAIRKLAPDAGPVDAGGHVLRLLRNLADDR